MDMIWQDKQTEKYRTRFCPHYHQTEESALRCFRTRARERERELGYAKQTLESYMSKDTMKEWVDNALVNVLVEGDNDKVLRQIDDLQKQIVYLKGTGKAEDNDEATSLQVKVDELLGKAYESKPVKSESVEPKQIIKEEGEEFSITIEGEKHMIENVTDGEYLPNIESEVMDWYVAKDKKMAGEAARLYWEDLAKNDPDEFGAIVGQASLVKWCLGQEAGPGSVKVKSLDAWLDLYLDHPEEEFATYDGKELVGEISEDLRAKLGFPSAKVVAYRHN